MLYSKKLSLFPKITHGFTTKKDNTNALIKNAVWGEQTHSNNIQIIKKSIKKKIPKIDGLITSRVGTQLTIKTADCVPLLLFDPISQIVSAIHAGWKGTRNGIVINAIQKMIKEGAKDRNIILVIGPSIGVCCYNVPEERTKNFHTKSIVKRSNNFFIDLKKENYLQALELGVRKVNIEILNYCTYEKSDLFFSFRRDKEIKGSMYSFISITK